MAHECEECGQACDCEGEDTWFDEQPSDCRHFTEKGYCEAGMFDECQDDFVYEDDDLEIP